MAADGNRIGVSEPTLKRRLRDRGLLRTTGKANGRETLTIRKTLQGIRREVMHLKRATLEVEARDDSGKPMTGLKFQGRFERPTDKRADLPVELAEVGIGVYRGTARSIAPGQWDLVLEGDAAGRRMFLSKNRVLLN